MTKVYQDPELEMLLRQVQDVCTTSGTPDGNPDGSDGTDEF